MADMNFRDLTALEQGRLIKEKKITSRELTEYYIAASQADFAKQSGDEMKINAYISLDGDAARARATAVQADIDAGKYADSPLAGVPVAIKDNMCVDGGVSTSASRILEGFRPPYTATAVRKLLDAGAVIIGKTNMDEFAMGGSTETSYFGVTRNPWDTSRVPGGSSGGSAAAVAAGFAPYSLGSDTGGSIRQPAAFTGVTGFKPTYGSVSRFGLMAFASSLDQIGPLAKDAKDCAAIMSLISGPDERDSTCVAGTPFDARGLLGEEAAPPEAYYKGKRIAVPSNYFAEGVSPGVTAGVKAAIEEMRGLGAEIREIELPLADYAVPVYLIVSFAEASSNLSRYDGVKYGYRSKDAKDLLEAYYKSRSEGFGTEVKRRVMLGSFVLSSGYFDAYYKKALKVRYLIKQEFDRALADCDLILTPATPTAAYGLGGKIKDPLAMYLGDIFTVSVNLAGLPAVSLPCAADADEGGLPIGMQLIGRAWDDMALLEAAAAYQGATNYHRNYAWNRTNNGI
jgi:aspartyl-tRNA(Asn)/glutamyl-tRNA(Gln) amidotransferase subunit A